MSKTKVQTSSEQKDNQENQRNLPNFERLFQNCTNNDSKHFKSWKNFTSWLHRPVDGSALGIFRMLYGAAMLIDIAEERGGQLEVRFGDPQTCHFPLFNGIRAASFPLICLIYLCMWLGAIGIMLGYRFRLSCVAFIAPYWYIFLLDKPTWNNHSYLFGLVGSMLLFTQANRYCSLDKHFDPALPNTVPYWNYFIIKFQFFLLYMYAGLKKFTAEWLSGYSMTSLSRHWVFAPFRSVMSLEMTDLLIVHWFTAVFDFVIAFLMTSEKTRLLATPFMLSFHLMNSRLFVIGMFPWVCLAEVPLFFDFSWPRKLLLKLSCKNITKRKTLKSSVDSEDESKVDTYLSRTTKSSGNIHNKKDFVCKSCYENLKADNGKTKAAQFRTVAILAYCGLQLFLPYSHFITKGYNNWTSGLYGYSWDMMVHSYDTILTSIKIVDNNNDRVHYLDPYAFTEYDRWTKYADMALQYAKCIELKIYEEHAKNPETSPLSSTNFSIYFDIWCSMNGRFQQRVFDPRVDMLHAQWSPFERTSWSLPLLNELNHLRPKLRTIAHDVLNWSNYSDVIFVADFPGLTLDNFISPDLTNVSLTILEGNVRYESDDETEAFFLTAGQSFELRSDTTHHVTTIGLKPSCYLYTYVNKTMLETGTTIDVDGDLKEALKPTLPLWQEFQDRWANYKRFLALMGNCLLFWLYNVPFPMEVRERRY